LWEIEKASPSDAPRTVSVWASPISSTNFSASRPPVFHPPIAPFRLSRIFGTGEARSASAPVSSCRHAPVSLAASKIRPHSAETRTPTAKRSVCV
jgi:hypothetical protein